MKFAQPSLNRQNMAYDPKITPFVDHAKRLSQPRREISPKRKPLNINPRTLLTTQPQTEQLVTSRFADQDFDPQNIRPSKISTSFDKVALSMHQSKKFSKTAVIQQFRESINSVKNKIFLNQYEIDNDLDNLQKQYQNEIHQIDSSFEQLFQLLNVRYGKCLERVKHKYQTAKRSIISYSITSEQTLQFFDKFEGDIDKHYHQIINQLSLDKLNDIIYKYNSKLTQFESKINNTPDLRLCVQDEKKIMEDMIDMLIRQDSRKRNRSSINESEKDYEINFDDIHIDMTKSKTTRNGNK